MNFATVGVLLLFCLVGTIQEQTSSSEQRIKQRILKKYDRTTRPVKSDRTLVHVNVAISLYHILDTNEKEQTLTCLLAIRQRWRDEYLAWNESQYNDVNTIRIPVSSIWRPDIVISNFAGEKFNDYMVTNAIVTSDGMVLLLYPALSKTYCTLNIKYFPFDKQSCKLEFISWTHNGYELDLDYNSSFANSIYYKPENQEWFVEGITQKRNVKYYACCKEPYPDLTFEILMKRGSLFYIINLIAPCFLIFLVSFLGFFLPVESGEKVNLEMTILLALVVFLLMVGETMPPTPDCVPVLGMYFASTMIMVTIALVMSVTVTNIYSKKNFYKRPSKTWMNLASRFYRLQSHSTTNFEVLNVRRGKPSLLAHQNSSGDILASQIIQSTSRESHLSRTTSGTSSHNNYNRLDSQLESEWQTVANFTDRIFFWVFLLLSIIVHTSLFVHMAPEGILPNQI